MTQEFDEGGNMDYSMKVRSPIISPAATTSHTVETSPKYSTPIQDEGHAALPTDKRLVLKITPVEARTDLSFAGVVPNKDVDISHKVEVRADESLPSPSIIKKEHVEKGKVSGNIPQKLPQELPEKVSKTDTVVSVGQKPTSAHPPPAKPSTCGQSAPVHESDRRAKTQAEFIDLRIQDTVTAGFQVFQSEWEEQSKKFDRVEEQIVSMRVDVQKVQPIPAELRKLKNQIELVQSAFSSLNAAYLQIQSDVSCISENDAQTRADVQATKATVLSVKADATVLKGDTHTLKSKVVANTVTTVAVQSQVNNVLETDLNISHEIRILKGDVVQLHGNLITVKSDMAAMRTDVVSMKAQVASIANGIEQLTRSLLARPLGEIQMLPQNVDVKSDSDQDRPTTPAAVPSTSSKDTGACASPSGQLDAAATDSDFNLSEVTFKKADMLTYEHQDKTAVQSPRTPTRKTRIKLFDSNTSLEEIADSQQTQDPTNFVGDTEYTEGSQSPTMGWPKGNELQGTVYEEAAAPVDAKKGTYLSVINPAGGRGPENPESLVPIHAVRDLEQRLTHQRESRSSSKAAKKAH